jgi:ferritin-like protein
MLYSLAERNEAPRRFMKIHDLSGCGNPDMAQNGNEGAFQNIG